MKNKKRLLFKGKAKDGIAPVIGVLSLGATTSDSQVLNWTAATDNIGIVAYDIYRSTDGVSYSYFKTVGNVLTDTITGLSASTLYYWSIIAKDAANNASSGSNVVSATTSASGVEVYPQNNAAAISDDLSIGDWYGAFSENTTVVNSVDAHDGSNCLEMTQVSSSRNELATVPITSGKTYTVSVWAKVVVGSTARFDAWTGFSNFTRQDITSTSWTEFTWTLTANATGTALIRVYPAYGGSAGDQILIDKFTIIET